MDKYYKENDTIDIYTIQELLGEGRYGIVYLAIDKDKNKYVVKQLKKVMIKKSENKLLYEGYIILTSRNLFQDLKIMTEKVIYLSILRVRYLKISYKRKDISSTEMRFMRSVDSFLIWWRYCIITISFMETLGCQMSSEKIIKSFR